MSGELFALGVVAVVVWMLWFRAVAHERAYRAGQREGQRLLARERAWAWRERRAAQALQEHAEALRRTHTT